MGDFKMIILIMVLLVSFTAIANKKKLPYPVLLVFAGLVIGFIPHLQELVVDPDIIFVIILPPLLYDAASKTSWHEFKIVIRPIAALAITLVFFTTTAVAVTAHYLIPGFSWPLAFVLGAIVSPPDAVAATGIIQGLGLNKKVITIIEGESLMNDASALITYRYAVAAVTTGSFVFWKAGLQFLLVAGGGIIIGISVGYVFALIHKKILNNPVVETSLTLLAPFISYLAAEQFHLSGVLAVVCTGLVMAWRAPEVFSYQTRMRTRVVWDTLMFLLHGFVFILIGLQLPLILKDLGNYPLLQILGYGLLVSLVTIVVRIVWVFSAVYLQNIFQNKPNQPTGNESDTWKSVLVVAWTGTRGIISLATALALPLVLANGNAFPKRYSIIFLAFVVIFVTLVVQGLSLPLLIRWLKIKPQDNTIAEEKELQLHLAVSTLHFIEEELPLALSSNLKDELKNKYEIVIKNLSKEIRRHKKAIRNAEQLQPAPTDVMINAKLEINKFKRGILLQLHKDGQFTDAAIKKAEREMDIDELKLNIQVTKEE
jgi:CPA1 family monovalent cation:H+ antiporter